MRMWMVNPKVMCRNHLLGEHAEIHMLVWNIDRDHSVKGYLDNGLLETHNLYNRHKELAQELRRRGYQHNSALDAKWKLAKKAGSIDKEKSLKELVRRCVKCKERYLKLFGTDH
ncbi:hypothetical protein JXA31_02350 [Candidatus Bathyarchaeota archaeon]|nr:hypothetical protein [Candidatus Bathyarchaeota archaeon]